MFLSKIRLLTLQRLDLKTYTTSQCVSKSPSSSFVFHFSEHITFYTFARGTCIKNIVDINKKTQLIAMNFIMIILVENVFYNKFSASIKILNAMHVKAKYFTIKYSGANSATIYVYATSLSKVVWLEYYPLALNHIWCLETHEENCLIPLLIIWNKNWTCILCPEINRKTQEIPLSA